MPIKRNPHDRAFRIRVERQKRRNEITKILAKHKQEVETRCKVHQLGIGFKVQDGKISEEIGILAFVEKKMTESQLKEKQIEPIEKIVKEAITDVVEFPSGIQPISGVVEYDKINGGIPARHYQKPGSGTLGIIVKRAKKPKIMNYNAGTSVPANAKFVAIEYLKKPDEYYSTFVENIRYWILEGKIKNPVIPPSASNVIENPNELKNIVQDWVNGVKTDAEFLFVLQKLISDGVVKLPISDDLYALTNYHVGAKEPVVGSSSLTKKGDVWTFPGFSGYKTFPSKGVVAKFVDGKQIFPGGQNRLNYYDVAVAKISDNWKNIVRSYEITEIGNVKGMDDAEIGDQVMKFGKTSSLTEGIVTGIVPHPQKITINYNGTNCDFTEQLIIVGNPTSKPFSKLGDSGSLVVSKEVDSSGAHTAIALLFSGATAANGIYYSFANPIKKIAEDFELDFSVD